MASAWPLRPGGRRSDVARPPARCDVHRELPHDDRAEPDVRQRPQPHRRGRERDRSPFLPPRGGGWLRGSRSAVRPAGNPRVRFGRALDPTGQLLGRERADRSQRQPILRPARRERVHATARLIAGRPRSARGLQLHVGRERRSGLHARALPAHLQLFGQREGLHRHLDTRDGPLRPQLLHQPLHHLNLGDPRSEGRPRDLRKQRHRHAVRPRRLLHQRHRRGEPRLPQPRKHGNGQRGGMERREVRLPLREFRGRPERCSSSPTATRTPSRPTRPPP